MAEDVDFQKRMGRIETLVRELESMTDPQSRANAVELVSLLMELQGAGLSRILEILSREGASAAVEQFVQDPLVSNLLLMYGLHPVELEPRVQQALAKVRPLLQSHGGNVALLGIADGVVRLSLQGSCHGCPSSARTLKNAIEEAIHEFAPDIAELQVEGVTAHQLPVSGFVPLAQLV